MKVPIVTETLGKTLVPKSSGFVHVGDGLQRGQISHQELGAEEMKHRPNVLGQLKTLRMDCTPPSEMRSSCLAVYPKGSKEFFKTFCMNWALPLVIQMAND